jgi:hypothetical protein
MKVSQFVVFSSTGLLTAVSRGDSRPMEVKVQALPDFILCWQADL